MSDAVNPSHDADSHSEAHSTTSTHGQKFGSSAEKKRKLNASGTSSRGVANLTPEQLAKKRANDREAQRAIRERTKNQIQTLEQRIKELTSQQPYQELQHVLRQKELIELENADIKRRLAAVLELIQPILNGNGIDTSKAGLQDDLSTSSGPSYGAYHSNHAATTARYSAAAIGSVEPSTARSSPSPWSRPLTQLQSPASPHGSFPYNDRASSESRGRSSVAGELPALLRTTSAERRALGLLPIGRPEIQSGAHLVERPSPHAITHSSLPADSHITIATTQSQPHMAAASSSSSSNSTSTSTSTTYEPRSYQSRPAHACVPQYCAPVCTLDSLLLDFVNERRARLAEGIPEAEVLGPKYPSFNTILYPNPNIPTHPMTRFFRDILATFPDINTPVEKIAVAYVMFLIMRWHISPTAEHFERMPTWVRPTTWQITMPHPIWLDHLPWPDMRSEIVKNYQRYPFESFFIPFTRTLKVHWPEGDLNLYENPRGAAPDGECVLSRAFEANIRNLDNWSLGSAFAREYPLLIASVRIEDCADKKRIIDNPFRIPG
jgi:hypothetical protein